MGAVRDRMRDDMLLRNYAEATIDHYLEYACEFVGSCARRKRSPETRSAPTSSTC
jgi:hypothetical protein